MADKRIIQLPDTPGLDTTTDEMVVDNAVDGVRRVPVGRAGGVAILDANGKILSRLGYEGQPGGVATLDSAGAVVQDPASLNQANGVAGLDASKDLIVLKAVRASIPANGQVSLADAEGLIRRGMIIIVTDGNSSPGHVFLQIFRNGTYNEAVASANINWVVGGTADPGTGDFRVWVDGQAANAPLILKSTVSYGRNVRILQFPVTL